MQVPAMPVRATNSLFRWLFGRHSAKPASRADIKRRARIDLAHLPPYLQQDIGLFDD